MKKNIIKSIIFGLTTVATAGLLNVSGVSAWGPERPTFTMDNPATYPTFNSITDAPDVGDERDFVRVGQINDDVTALKNEVEVIPGHQYLVYIYFHNNASATFNDAAHNNSGVAFQTRMYSTFPNILAAGERGTITGKISAENSNPLEVWDEAYFTTSSEKVYLHYVAGSAKIYNDWRANGSVMPSTLFTDSGTYIGLNSLNGIILGCEEYHGSVMYVVQADTLEGTIDKTISKDGQNFAKGIEVDPGDEVTYKLTIKNMGGIELTNLVVKDSLPEKMTIVPGSVEFWANESTTKDQLPDGIITDGYNLGTMGTGNTAYITYRAKVGDDFDCNSLNLTNLASITYDNETTSGDTRTDSATATVQKDGCDPTPPTPTPEDCTTNPNLPECQRIPDTGPVEIILAIVIVLGLCGAGFYFWRTHKKVKAVENKVAGKDEPKPESQAEPKPEEKAPEQK